MFLYPGYEFNLKTAEDCEKQAKINTLKIPLIISHHSSKPKPIKKLKKPKPSSTSRLRSLYLSRKSYLTLLL